MRAPSNTLEPLRVTLTERSNTFPLYQHAGTELIYMLSGRMEYGYGSSRYLLESGDSILFESRVPHRNRNPGPGSAKVLWVTTPPSY